MVASYGKPASQVDRRIDYDGDGTITERLSHLASVTIGPSFSRQAF